jgi:hypothetical protein
LWLRLEMVGRCILLDFHWDITQVMVVFSRE